MRWLLLFSAIAGLLLMGCRSGSGGGAVVVSTVSAGTPSPTAETVRAESTVAPSTTVSPEPADGAVTLAAVGDVMLARSIGGRVVDGGAADIFAGVRDHLAGADIAFANVECAISDMGSPANKGYTFEAPPQSIDALLDGGLDVVSQANNHALDYGPDALLDTRSRLEVAGIAVAGSGANDAGARTPAIVERNGLRFAFLAYVDTAAEGSYNEANWDATAERTGVAWATAEKIAADVIAAKQVADVVVVSMHAGVEYDTTPSASQRLYAETAIDAGATLVLGAHPHVLQPVEEYNGGLIAFSLGNFVFDGFDGEANTTAILEVTFDGTSIASWKTVPVSVVDGLPVLD